MSSGTAEKIKEKLDIVEVVGSYLKLEKVGSNFKAKCPFHNEKTPSFFVSPSRGGYYCFGCGAKGDIFNFVEQFEGLDFYGALKVLAARAGVNLRFENKTDRNVSARLYDALDCATDFFTEELSRKPAVKKYLLERGLKEKTILSWRLGYARNEWRALHGYLLSKKFTDAEMLEVGLIKAKENSTRGETYYDTFRDRIMFPIFDTSGRVVAFSGRTLSQTSGVAKYLNSPETKLFKKSDVLFGLDRAKFKIRRLDYSILVEGQMDLIMAHQAGFENAVASSGTALTESHLKRLQKLSNRVIFAFDGDQAGFAAADRGAKLALELGMEVKLAALPVGSDPADLLRKKPKVFKEVLVGAKPIVDFYLDLLLAQKLDARKLAMELVRKVLPYVAALKSAVLQSHYVNSIADKTGLRQESLWADLAKVQTVESSVEQSTGGIGPTEPASRQSFLANQIRGLIFLEESDEIELPFAIKNKVEELLGEKALREILSSGNNEKSKLVFEAENLVNSKILTSGYFGELLSSWQEESLKAELAEKISALRVCEKTRDEKNIIHLLKDCQEISSRLDEISKKKYS